MIKCLIFFTTSLLFVSCNATKNKKTQIVAEKLVIINDPTLTVVSYEQIIDAPVGDRICFEVKDFGENKKIHNHDVKSLKFVSELDTFQVFSYVFRIDGASFEIKFPEGSYFEIGREHADIQKSLKSATLVIEYLDGSVETIKGEEGSIIETKITEISIGLW